jgi:hypothetical protein
MMNASRNFGVVEIAAGGHHTLAELRIVEQQRRQFVRQFREEVGHRMVVEPQARWCDQSEPLDLARRRGRHLGRDHASHRMADQDRAIESKSIDHVECMQSDGEHVAQVFGAL